MPTVQPVKGTRDFYPEDLAFRRWLYERIREVSESFGYQEFDAPFLEKLELYAAKSGEELVKEQSFVFPDRGGEMITLRPELTPSLARMVAARSASLPRPIRWWSFGPFWRYERPQRGRSREFFQWNIDLIGLDSPQADAELASVAASFFRSIGLPPTDVRLLVNNRRLADAQLDGIGVPAVRRPGVFRMIDRRDRLSDQEWLQEADKLSLTPSQLRAIERMLEDRQAWKKSEELQAFFEACDAMGTSDYLEFDPSVIRGLDYYTGTVFEARDKDGELRAILGGGRYDDLVSDVGGEPLPGVGFAMGDVVLALLIEKQRARPSLRPSPADVLVATFDPSLQMESIRLAAELRRAGLKVEWYPSPDRLPKQIKYADRQGLPLMAIIGPDELAADEVSIRDLQQRTQVRVPRSQAASRLRAFLEESTRA
ncbi:MAG: histidine--tRNA ligase [Chloroflexota bacterium]